MRQGRARPHGHDRGKRRAIAPEQAELVLQGIANLLLRLLRVKAGTDHGERFFRNPGRLANQRKFFLILDLPQVLHYAGGSPESPA